MVRNCIEIKTHLILDRGAGFFAKVPVSINSELDLEISHAVRKGAAVLAVGEQVFVVFGSLHPANQKVYRSAAIGICVQAPYIEEWWKEWSHCLTPPWAD